jgi:Na+/glutamate symporter
MTDPGLALAAGLAAATFTLFLAIIAGGALRWGLRRRPATDAR